MDEYFVQESKFLHKRDKWRFTCKTVSTDFNSTQVDYGIGRLLRMFLFVGLICYVDIC